MTLNRFFFSLKRYGIKGAITAFGRLFQRDTPLHKTLLRLAKNGAGDQQRGITIIGDLSSHSSLPKVMRDLYAKLQACGIPCQCLDLTKPIDEKFELLKYDHVIAMLQNPLPKQLRARVKTALIVFWEFDTGVLDAYPFLLDTEQKIAMSDFNYDCYRAAFTDKYARKILYPFQMQNRPSVDSQTIRSKFGIPQNAFVVFFNFELGTKRKNPEGILSAFAKAFPNNANAVLVFKTMSVKRFPECLNELNEQAAALGITDRFITINTYLPDEELQGLTNACDVYISLHRGEGFGLGIAEAMLQGKPVIVTNWSAPCEFCNAENAILIPYTFTPIQTSARPLPYDGVTRWAEPDVDAAAKALRRLYDDPTLRRQLGERGRKTIREHFSIENFKKSIDAFLSEETVANPVDANFCSRSNGRKHHF